MNVKAISFIVLLSMVICRPLYGAETKPVSNLQVLNVVLIELDTSPDTKQAKPIINDWDYWSKCAGKLIVRLESDLGYARATNDVKRADASIFAIRGKAKSLCDAKDLDAVIRELDKITEITQRPSFLLVWMPNEKVVLLGLQDNIELRARTALDMLCHILPPTNGARFAMVTETPYVAPPCVLAMDMSLEENNQSAFGLDGILGISTVEKFLNCLATTEYQLVDCGRIMSLNLTTPTGTEFQVMIVTAGNSRGMDNATAFARDTIFQKTGESPLVAHTIPQVLSYKEQGYRNVILQQPFSENLGNSIKANLTSLQGKATVNFISNSYEAGDTTARAILDYTKQPGQITKIDKFIMMDYSETGQIKPTGVLPRDLYQKLGGGITNTKGLAQTAVDIRGKGIDTIGITEQGKWGSQHFQNVKNFEQAGIPVWTTNFDPKININPSIGTGGLSASPGVSNLRDQAGDFGVNKLWTLHNQGNEAVTVGKVSELPSFNFPKPSFKPAGILLSPELEIVVDAKGITGQLAAKAVAVVKGEKAGGEFTFEDKKYIAAKTPNTAGLFRVRAGNFVLEQKDLSLSSAENKGQGLCRYYDSASEEESPLGPRWSFFPFSLRLGQCEDLTNLKVKAALKPILVDRQSGVELEYELMPLPKIAASDDTAEQLWPQYRKRTSSLQPDLLIDSNGTYIIRFVHGFEVVFDMDGRLLSLGNPTDKIIYTYKEERLTGIKNSTAKIEIEYDTQGMTKSAKVSDGRHVDYVMDEKGQLATVTGSESGRWVFSYEMDNRLASIKRGTGQEAEATSSLIAENKYDAKGRMVMHRTPQGGELRFVYDDEIGRVVITGPDGKGTSYYYDGYQRLVAYGSAKGDMTLLNYDVSGRILQIAKGELLNNPSGGERPRFKVLNMVTPLPHEKETKQEG